MKKSNTAARLNQIMTARDLKQSQILELARPFCKKHNIKLGKSSLSQYVNGNAEPGQDKLFILGLTLNVSEAWLMGYDVPMERDFREKEMEKVARELHSSLSLRESGVPTSCIIEEGPTTKGEPENGVSLFRNGRKATYVLTEDQLDLAEYFFEMCEKKNQD